MRIKPKWDSKSVGEYERSLKLREVEASAPMQGPDYKALWEQMCQRCDELDAKLAEAEKQEPVAWFRYENGLRIYYETKAWGDLTPLYTHPQPKRAWQSLTDEEIELLWEQLPDVYDVQDHARAIEAKLREKNDSSYEGGDK